MIPVPKKHRKISHSDSTHTGRFDLTSSDNPLLIQGYNVFDKQYKDNTVHNQICDTIRESLNGISDPSSVNVIFQIGRLMSVVQSRSIFLPVENEAVLDFDFNKVKFVPNASKKCIDLLYLNVFASKSNFSKLVPNLDYLEVELISSKTSTSASTNKAPSGLDEALNKKKSDGINNSRIYRIPFNFNETLDFTNLESYINNYLNSVIVYRPQSEYHFKVQTNSFTPLYTNTNHGTNNNNGSSDDTSHTDDIEGTNVSKILFRHIRTYRTSKTPNYKLIKFNLEVIDQWDVPVNNELLSLKIHEMMKAFFEAFIATNSSKAHTFLDLENSEESKVKIIQFSSNSQTKPGTPSNRSNENGSEANQHKMDVDSPQLDNANTTSQFSTSDTINTANYESQLCKQYRRMLKSKPNRFEFIISLLTSNTRMLLELFSNPTSFISSSDSPYNSQGNASLNSNRGSDDNMVDMSDFYPNLFGDTSEFAQIHYDTRKIVRQQESAIQALRKYNNLVKRLLILAYIKQNSTVLDLACGHAQDLDKYDVKRIKKLMGIDISLREINEARKRYFSRKRLLSYSAEFHHGNILDSRVYSVFVKNRKFDVVSIQLAIHYILESEVCANFILKNIHECLNDGGLFIGSTVCCERIAQELSMNPPTQNDEQQTTWTFGNPIFKVTMEQKSMDIIKASQQLEDTDQNHISRTLNSTWGLKYHFFLMESIDEGEYIVPWNAFVDICTKIGFKLVESLTFPEYLEKSKMLFKKRSLELPQNVYENIDKHLNSIATFQLSNEQARAFSLYKIFIFEKITTRDKLYMQGVKIKK